MFNRPQSTVIALSLQIGLAALALIAVTLGANNGSAQTTATQQAVRENLVPDQHGAISAAASFMDDFDAGQYRSAYQKFKPPAPPSPMEFSLQADTMRRQLQGPAFKRELVGMAPMVMIPGNPMPGEYLQLRYRSIRPVGAVYEDIWLRNDGSNGWSVVGIWFGPALY
jgi:hypothetical protein